MTLEEDDVVSINEDDGDDPEVEESVVDVVVNVILNAVAAIPSKAFA